MTPIDEMIRNDHKDLLSCVYERVKTTKRDLKEPGSYSLVHLAASTDNSQCLKYLLEQEQVFANEICNL